jgi:hypothetical protein
MATLEENIIDIILNSPRIAENFVRKNRISSDFGSSSEINDLSLRISSIEKQLSQLIDGKIILSEGQLNLIVDRVLECISLNRVEQSTSIESNGNPVTFKYLPSITTRGFPNIFSDQKGDSYFGFFNIKDGMAEFQYCGDNFERARANKLELEKACEISGSTSESKEIINIENGTVTLQDNKWFVTKKARIKFV